VKEGERAMQSTSYDCADLRQRFTYLSIEHLLVRAVACLLT